MTSDDFMLATGWGHYRTGRAREARPGLVC